MKLNFQKILYLSISILLLLLLLYLSNRYSSEEISLFISNAGIFAPITYILIQILGQIFAPLSTSALFVAGFLMFGRLAIVYCIITWLISSFINFYLARNYGRKVLKLFIGKKGIKDIEDIANRIDTKQFFLLRFTSFYINDFASYAFGLTNISFLKYYIATIVSMIPWSIIMVLLIQKNESLLITTVKLFLSMIPFAILSYIYFRKDRKKLV
jgi:uncharacterized membrane protein YdjX (TVP38/TMEM64 family)